MELVRLDYPELFENLHIFNDNSAKTFQLRLGSDGDDTVLLC